MAKTNDFQLCENYLRQYLDHLQKQLRECQEELRIQAAICPIKELSLDQIDRALKDLATQQRNYVSKRNNGQQETFQQRIRHRTLRQSLDSHSLSQEQVLY